MKGWKLVLIPFVLVILAVGTALAINWWEDSQIAPGGPTIKQRLEGVADWAKEEQKLRSRGKYTFLTTPELNEVLIVEERTHLYRLSDGSIYGYIDYREKQQKKYLEEGEYIAYGAAADYVRVLLESEAEYLKKELHISDKDIHGVFFAISDDPEILLDYYNRCCEGNFCRK